MVVKCLAHSKFSINYFSVHSMIKAEFGFSVVIVF